MTWADFMIGLYAEILNSLLFTCFIYFYEVNIEKIYKIITWASEHRRLSRNLYLGISQATSEGKNIMRTHI